MRQHVYASLSSRERTDVSAVDAQLFRDKQHSARVSRRTGVDKPKSACAQLFFERLTVIIMEMKSIVAKNREMARVTTTKDASGYHAGDVSVIISGGDKLAPNRQKGIISMSKNRVPPAFSARQYRSGRTRLTQITFVAGAIGFCFVRKSIYSSRSLKITATAS